MYDLETELCLTQTFSVSLIREFWWMKVWVFLINFAGIAMNQWQICFFVVVVHKMLLCLCSVILSVKMPGQKHSSRGKERPGNHNCVSWKFNKPDNNGTESDLLLGDGGIEKGKSYL